MPGTTQYPTSVDNNIERTDGVDIIVADDVNNAYAQIEALETFLGASGASQSHNTDLLTFLFGQKPRITLSWVDANTVQASTGVVMTSNAAGSIKKVRKNTVTTNITFSDLDSGARALNTQYYVWAIGDATATTVTFKISTSSSAPTGPTHYALIGKFKTNGTGAGEIVEDTVFSEGFFNVNFLKQVIKGAANIDGDAGTAVLRDSFNVSSIVDNGAGDYTINWAIPFADANYFVAFGVGGSNQANARAIIHTQSAASLRFQVTNTSNALVDHDVLCVIACGDQ